MDQGAYKAQHRALGNIPQENWDEYMALFHEYMDLRGRWCEGLKKSKAYWDEKIKPYLEGDKEAIEQWNDMARAELEALSGKIADELSSP